MVASTSPRAGGHPPPTARAAVGTHVKRWWLTALLVAAINEAGVGNVLASTMLTFAAPVMATAFVYQVGAMRHAALAREAADRAQYAARLDAEPNDGPQERRRDQPLPESTADELSRKLDSMLASRASILDTFGDDPSAVAPIYVRIIKQMLRDDEQTFTALAQPRRDEAADPDALPDKESRLRDMHARLAHLAGA